MKTIVNKISFKGINDSSIEFFWKHGWVVIEDFISCDMIENVLSQWITLKNNFSNEMGLSITQYENEVSQWRDLWLHGGAFNDMITRTEFIHSSVMNLMGWQGVRLLHDHLVTKPNEGSNKKIPWHQDSMFWPVDTHGCSTWTALKDVEVEDGCLEVIDKSHLEGCENPVDFMAKEREEFPEGSVRVNAGSTILLHSLTWHRSSPNLGKHDRPAHLALWVHPDAKWRPDLVDWHPVNEHVESEPNTRLEGKKFPHFGIIDELQPTEIDIHSGTHRENNISMFDASKIVGHQLSRISDSDGGITQILKDGILIERIVEKTVELGFCSDEVEIRKSLERLRVSYLAYELHKARNVYNDAYANWWNVAGEDWDNFFRGN